MNNEKKKQQFMQTSTRRVISVIADLISLKRKQINPNVWENSKKHSQSLKKGASPLKSLRPLTRWGRWCVFNLWDLVMHPSDSVSRTFSLRPNGIFSQSYLSNNIIVAAEKDK